MSDEALWADLRAEAQGAFERAYAPYSGFKVGAALRASDGRRFAGGNVENASYGLSRCAEQSAVQALASAGGRGLTHIYVFTAASPPSTPCGACRQVLFEFGPDAEVRCGNAAGEERSWTVLELIPGAFGPTDLGSRH
jgi:cytidine deaminase